ncbi:MAG TPA: GntR family transcriptional regulator [Acidimicrobiales bacterium]|nr:GntR family transcriptional regulator [Acidimicrobiales bacterium]
MSAQLNRQGLREQLKEHVLRRIISGIYPPGTRITEVELMNEFGVSQAPVREALRELEAMRFLESKPHQGARVRLVSLGELVEMYPVRAALEEVAGRFAASKVTEDHLLRLSDEIAAMSSAARRGDAHDENLHDYRFHELIFEYSGNSLLLGIWHSMHFEIRALVTYLKLPLELKTIAEDHLPILDALRSADPELAGRTMRAHVEKYGGLVAGLPRGEVTSEAT